MLAVQLPEFVADAGERELGDVRRAAGAVALAEVVGRRQCLSSTARNLEEDVRSRFPFADERVVDPRQDVVELDLLNVLRGIDAKSCDAEPREHHQIVGDLLPDGREPGVEVGQREQLAILNIRCVLIVVHRTGRMEIARPVQSRIIVFRVRSAVTADPGARIIGHVIDHGIDDDVDARPLAASDHVGEFRARPRAAPRDAVADRLVALAPIVSRNDAVFFGWRDLHGPEAGGAEHSFALGGDIGPLPLEEVHEHVARGHVPRGPVGGRKRRTWRGRITRRRRRK